MYSLSGLDLMSGGDAGEEGPAARRRPLALPGVAGRSSEEMDRTTETAKAVVESELGVEVTSIWLAEEKEFLGVKLAIWRARTQGGKG